MSETRSGPKVYVLHWWYSDGSARGVGRAYTSKEAGVAALHLLNELGDGMKSFELAEVDLITRRN